MSDDAPELAEVPAPELDTTAAPEPLDTETPETPAEQEASKTFSQEELDAIVGKRLAREQRKWEREQAQKLSEAQSRQPAQSPTDLTPEQFDTYEDYANALAEHKAEVLLERRATAKEQQALLEQYHDREETARDRYDDFDQVAYNPNLPVTEYMAQSIQSSDVGPDLLYWLGFLRLTIHVDQTPDEPGAIIAKEINSVPSRDRTSVNIPTRDRTSALSMAILSNGVD